MSGMLLLLLLSVFLEGFFPAFIYVTAVITCWFYIRGYAGARKAGRADAALTALLVICLGAVFGSRLLPGGWIRVFNTAACYTYILYLGRRNTGEWNRLYIQLMAAGVSGSVFSMMITAPPLRRTAAVVILLLQTGLILKYLDPVLTEIAMEHKRKRLAAEKNAARTEEGGETCYDGAD